MTTVEIIALAQKLSGVGFGTLVALILYWSYKGVWIWGTEMARRQADFDRQLAEAKAATEEAKAQTERWQAMTFAATGLAETSIGIQKTRVAK